MNEGTIAMTHPTRTRTAAVAAAAILILCLSGCRTTQRTQYLHENADLGAIQKVVVLPFDNVTSERNAAEKVQKIFHLELLSLDVFEVIEPGAAARAARATEVAALTPADFQRIGKELGVDGVFTGSIVDFAEARTGVTPTPEVTIQLRLVETGTGATIWSTGESRSGAGLSTRLFGVGGESLTQAARRIIRSELRTLLK
jgi:TolB-like protein